MDELYLPEIYEKIFSDSIEEHLCLDTNSLAFFKFILACVPAFIHIRDQQTGKILWCNDAWEKYFNIPKEEVINNSHEVFKKIVHPEDIELMKRSNDYYLNGSTRNFGGVIRVRYPDKDEWRWLIGISSVIKIDLAKIPSLTLAIFMDFTEVVHTQTQIQLALRDVLHLQHKEILNKVTNREKQVIQLVAKGLSNEEIAKKLFISHHTVESHRKNIRIKLQIKNTSELISYLKEIGI